MAVETHTFLKDPESLQELVEEIPEEYKAEYKSYGAMMLESAFPGRKMVVYTLTNGRPSDIEIITFGEFMCDQHVGPSFTVEGTIQMRVTSVPDKYAKREVFLHVPQTFELKQKARRDMKNGVSFISHYAVLVKTRSKDVHQVEGDTYCVTPKKFGERFPNVKIRF